MTHNMLTELSIGNRHYVVKVRIIKIWDSTNPFADNSRVMSVDFVAIDEQGTCIQGTMRTDDSVHIKRTLHEGYVYELANFNVIPARRTFRAVVNDRFIQLMTTSKINKLTDSIERILAYAFSCLEYSELPLRAYNDEYLTDVIGVLMKIGTTCIAYIREKPTEKRNILIQNESGQLLKVTLWGNHVNQINHDEMLAKTGPVILILSGMTVRQFKGEVCINSTSAFRSYIDLTIPIVENFINRLSPGEYKVQLLPEEQPPMRPAEAKEQNRKTIQDLLTLDTSCSQDIRFTCEATLKEINCIQGWWYKACPICFYGVKIEAGEASCTNHGPLTQLPIPWYKIDVVVEDATAATNFIIFGRLVQLVQIPAAILATQPTSDRYVLPNELKDLIGRTYIFQVTFNSRRARSSDVSFKVTKIFGPSQGKVYPQTSSTQSQQFTKDQTTAAFEHPMEHDKNVFRSDEDILQTPVSSQVQQELFANEESIILTPPGVPTMVRQDTSSSKKRSAQRDLLAEYPSKKTS